MALNNLEDRLECAIAHINTSVDIDPWAQKLAVESMRMRIALMKGGQPERKKDTIQKFHDYQVEWLKSHYDLELEPQLEEMIIRFLHDTANRYMMEEGGQNG